MSATTVPTQPCSGAMGLTDMAAWLGRTLDASEFAVFLFERAADRPRTRGAADRGHRQLRRNPVGATAAPRLVVLIPDCEVIM